MKSALQLRLEILRETQNPDGGWGFRPGRQSWLEPTFYAALALHGEPATDHAWNLVRQWQQPDGGWRPAGHVALPGWGTALCVIWADIRGERGEPFRKGVDWLLRTRGRESPWYARGMSALGLTDPALGGKARGWPWTESSPACLEPTVHALVALKRAARAIPSQRLDERIRLGEAQLFDIQAANGGWSYGDARRETRPSPWPETTALALYGLQGHTALESPLALTERALSESPTPLEWAWCALALRLHGRPVRSATGPHSPDLAVTALQALADEAGNYRLLSATGVA